MTAPIPHLRVRSHGYRHVVVGPSWSTVPHQRPIPGGNLYGYVHRQPYDMTQPVRGWLVIAADGSRPYGDQLWETLDRAVECLAET